MNLSARTAPLARAAQAGFGPALLVLVVLTMIPFMPKFPEAGLDPSWQIGMATAIGQGMRIGQEIVFTYGPYASVITGLYHPEANAISFFGAACFAMFFFSAGYALLRKSNPWKQWLFILALGFLTQAPDRLLLLYPMMVGFLLLRPSDQSDSAPQTITLLAALLFGMGLIPLIKLSSLAGFLGVLLVAIVYAFLTRNWVRVGSILVFPLLGLCFFWAASGQSLAGLPDYFTSAIQIIKGYTDAMSSDDTRLEIVAYLISCGIVFILVLGQKPDHLLSKAGVLCILIGMLFLAFKAGYVRHDGGHAVISVDVLLLTILVVPLTPRTNHLLWLTSFVVLTWNYTLTNYDYDMVFKRLDKAIQNIPLQITGLSERLSGPQTMQARYAASMADIQAQSDLSGLKGTADIYSYDQAYLLASGADWSPRPVLQSYSAYTSKLLEMNRDHLLSDRAADTIAFKLTPIDRRLHALADGASWPLLLSLYQPVRFQGGYVILERRNGARATSLAPLAEQEFAFGQKVEIPQTGGMVFAKVTLDKTTSGRLKSFVFKPNYLDIVVTAEPGATQQFRFVAGMGEAGFLINPLVTNTLDFTKLYAEANVSGHKKASAFVITERDGVSDWQQRGHVSFFKVPFPERDLSTQANGLATILPEGNFSEVTDTSECTGRFEATSRTQDPSASLLGGKITEIIGQLGTAASTETPPKQPVLVMTNRKGKRTFALGETASNAGSKAGNFAIQIAPIDFKKRQAIESATLGFIEQDHLFICTNLSQDFVIESD